MGRENWHTGLFDELGKYWVEIADSRATNKEAEFIGNVLRARGLLLDLCCGTARHSLALAEKGWDIVGLDISSRLLRVARGRMKGKHVFPLVRGDMQHLPFRANAFSVVISMFTSFGYLPSEAEDMASLKETARALDQDGRFLIDVANREHLFRVFQKKDWGEFPSFYMLEKRTLDAQASKLHSQWVILDKKEGRVRAFNHDLRLYTLPQLRGMLHNAELRVEEVYGDYDQQAFQQESPRLIILTRKWP
jgi:ubiquinone/menaquinone biosynthesis C-methylase UbiE